jgi:aminopeptidase N
MSTVVFDLNNAMTVSAVKMGAANLAFTQNGNYELIINLPSTLAANATATVEITYSGIPDSPDDGYVHTMHNGTPVVWTLSEPFGARDWWPCKQDLNDKADSIDIYITAPTTLTAVANGLQVETTTSGTSKTTHFHSDYPIAAYLVAFSVTNFSTFSLTAGTAPNEFPVINYVYPEHLSEAQGELPQIVDIIGLYEQLFETYPFHNEKYGHCEFGAGGGMEHQTVSFVTGFDRDLIAHELGHQWFGDKVTCGSWKDIWLNEGFASYLAALVVENFDGADSFVNYKSQLVDYITSQPGGAVYLTDSEALDSNRIFSTRLTYYKGAMVLEMLRWKLGDAAFFQGIREYLDDPDLAYNYATTPDLEAHLESASGQSLAEFFNDWVYGQGYPSYTAAVHNADGGIAQITLSQTQSSSVSFFEMPVPVRLYGTNGETADVVLNNTFNGQTFDENVGFQVASAVIDPDVHLISRDNSATLGSPAFALQQIRLYPNPANGQLQLSMPDGVRLQSATFTNVLGQTELKTGSQGRWDISHLATGLYFVRLATDAGTTTMKFIKQ